MGLVEGALSFLRVGASLLGSWLGCRNSDSGVSSDAGCQCGPTKRRPCDHECLEGSVPEDSASGVTFVYGNDKAPETLHPVL